MVRRSAVFAHRRAPLLLHALSFDKTYWGTVRKLRGRFRAVFLACLRVQARRECSPKNPICIYTQPSFSSSSGPPPLLSFLIYTGGAHRDRCATKQTPRWPGCSKETTNVRCHIRSNHRHTTVHGQLDAIDVTRQVARQEARGFCRSQRSEKKVATAIQRRT